MERRLLKDEVSIPLVLFLYGGTFFFLKDKSTLTCCPCTLILYAHLCSCMRTFAFTSCTPLSLLLVLAHLPSLHLHFHKKMRIFLSFSWHVNLTLVHATLIPSFLSFAFVEKIPIIFFPRDIILSSCESLYFLNKWLKNPNLHTPNLFKCHFNQWFNTIGSCWISKYIIGKLIMYCYS